MFRLDDSTRNTTRRVILLATVIGVSLFVGCRGAGRQPVAATPISPPLLLGADSTTSVPLSESAQAFRPIQPETPDEAAPIIPVLKAETSFNESALQKKIDDLSGKVAELERKLAEKDKKLAEKDEELKLALLPTDSEVPKPLSPVSAVPRKASPVLPLIGVVGVIPEIDGDDVRIRIPDSVLFQPGTMQLSPDGEDAIRNIASEIRTKYPKPALEIEGHTDNLQSDPANVMQKHETASLKAQVVLQYFLQSLQWTDTISSSGHGSSRPIADNASPEGRAQNNRIEIVVKGEGSREQGTEIQ